MQQSRQDMVRGRQGDGLAYAGADGGDDDDAPGLAARLRAAWEDRERDGGKSAGLDRGSSDERDLPRDPDDDSAQSLAERLRQAATGVDMGKVAERAAELQRERQAEEQHRVQAERKQARELEQERKEELARTRDRGPEYGL